MRRISQKTALIVTFGTAGNRNVQRSAAIIFCRKKGRSMAVKNKGCVGTVKPVHMGCTPPVSATACRRSFWRWGCAVRNEEERR